MTRPGLNFGNQDRRVKKMARIDSLSREQRMVVHEYGWGIVRRMIELGIERPADMRGLISIILHELRAPEINQLRGQKFIETGRQ